MPLPLAAAALTSSFEGLDSFEDLAGCLSLGLSGLSCLDDLLSFLGFSFEGLSLSLSCFAGAAGVSLLPIFANDFSMLTVFSSNW